MDLIDRYVIAVRRHLPRDLADDIVAELADSLRSEAEARERVSGHAITEAEQSELLKKRGHPWLMASRYQPQQYLIGPALFPYYWQALQLVLFWVVLPIVLIGGAINAIYSADPSVSTFIRELVRALTTSWNAVIYAVGIVTIVFFVLDHEKVRITALDNWNPTSLPEPSQVRFVPRSETVFGLVFTLTFITWWIGIVRVPDYFWQPNDDLRLALAPIWTTFYLPILVTAIIGAGVHLIDLVRPWRSARVAIVEVLNNTAVVVILAMILRAGEYVVVSGSGVNADNIDRAYWLNRLVGWGLSSTMVVIIIVTGVQLWRLLRARRAVATA